jgi:iron-sulfur cluster assembly protein
LALEQRPVEIPNLAHATLNIQDPPHLHGNDSMIYLRPAAVQELQRLLSHYPNCNNHVRIDLQPGGCAEWTYHLSPAIATDPEDQVFDCGDIQVIVAQGYTAPLQDLTIDYAEDLMGGGFRFINPQAQQSCGCGNAFSLSATAPIDDCSSHSALPGGF